MNLNLSQKERTLLEDQKSHEEICIQKYTSYANQATDPQLKNLFLQNAQIEREHYNTINQLLNGQMPAMNQSGGQQSGGNQQSGGLGQQGQQGLQQQMQQPNFALNNSSSNSNNSDKNLCTDMLMTEKYVSNAYDTAIFEFRDPQIRNVLNHIQKEEQQHGESIFKYMESKGLYQVK